MTPEDAQSPLASAWLKWARAVEHADALARATRQWQASGPHRYERREALSPFYERRLQVEWWLRVEHPVPPRLPVLVGDVLTNLRGALDHALWAAVRAHSGRPVKPNRVQFPIDTSERAFRAHAQELQRLVRAEVWQLVEKVQPFQLGEDATAHPLERLRWLSDVDRHRLAPVVEMMSTPLGPADVTAEPPVQVLSQWRTAGPVRDGDVLLQLVLRRPDDSTEVVLRPTFAVVPSLQVHDEPEEFTPLATALEAPKDWVLSVLGRFSSIMGLPHPDPASLEP
ncbi:hypothetical protein [Kineococcus radiotolerans]|uniref:Uncharacterized protein n=1 Tax=Kineococcus radiotolerans (strain ATCC BAA-149 / DSM 14245 / SRS30216) TaxID=266940 RepID=A6WC00_KINRD|nr:hypothetical protein [Kineococcus radiotolerans]ABS04339.1 hypothetical protein Krad_2873 [Kineococcus radiotolerans SRS30216 = ATCC BAA-149]